MNEWMNMNESEWMIYEWIWMNMNKYEWINEWMNKWMNEWIGGNSTRFQYSFHIISWK